MIPGAEISVTNEDTGIRRETTTNELGYFVVPLLQPGRYSVTVQKQDSGRSGSRDNARSGSGGSSGLRHGSRIRLRVDTGERQRDVGGHPVVDVEVGSRRAAHQRTAVERTRRDATVLLLPGVYGTVRDNSGLRQAGSGRGIVQAGIASNGARGNMVNYTLDGTTHNDTYTNVALAFPNPDALQEFSVQTNNFSAESGRSAGAVVTAVTKSGTNALHGSLFEFHRNGAVNARNFFAPTPDGLKRHQFGGTVGGPIWRDHTFFFFSHQETAERSRPSDATTTVLTEAQRRGDFSAFSGTITDPTTASRFPASRFRSAG